MTYCQQLITQHLFSLKQDVILMLKHNTTTITSYALLCSLQYMGQGLQVYGAFRIIRGHHVP